MTTNTGTAIIQAAHEDAGLVSLGQTITAAQTARGLARLNDYINWLATQGIKLWLQQDVTVPLVDGQASYTLGPAGDVVMARPLQVVGGYFLPLGGGNNPLTPLSREEYFRLYQPSSTGTPSQYYADRQATYTKVYFWNTPDAEAATGAAHLLVRASATNLAVATATTVFPQEWVLCLRWGTAAELATTQSQEIQNRCDQRAEAYRTSLEGFDVEDAPTRFEPSATSYGGGRSFLG